MEIMKKPAGRTWHTLLQEYEEYLYEDFLPFMDKYVYDHVYGGFMCHTNYYGKKISKDKRTWYDGRGIWMYSFLYNHIKKNPNYLEIAEKTINLVMKAKSKESLFWPWSYDRTGKDLKENTPDIYGNLFVAEGLAEYSVASGDASFWEQSKEILIQCMKLYDQKGYQYKLEYSPLDSFTHAERVLGHWMIMLRLSSSLLKIKSDQTLDELNKRCINALVHKHFNPRYNLMNEVLRHDFSQVSDSIEQFVYIGHSIESLWMLMDEAQRRDDRELFALAAKRFKFHVEVAWDDVYGGIFHCLNHVDKNDWLLEKVLWAQEEVLVGVMILIEQEGDPWAIRWFEKVYNYVIDKFPLHNEGSPMWQISGNRKLDFHGDGNRIENFHHPRHLMLNQLAIKRIINKQSS